MAKKVKNKERYILDKIARKYPELNIPLSEQRELVRVYYEIESAKQARIQTWVIVGLTALNVVLTLINVFS